MFLDYTNVFLWGLILCIIRSERVIHHIIMGWPQLAAWVAWNVFNLAKTLSNYPQNYNIPVVCLVHQKQKQPYKAVTCARTL